MEDELKAILNILEEEDTRLFGDKNETEDGISLFCLGIEDEDVARAEKRAIEKIENEIGIRF